MNKNQQQKKWNQCIKFQFFHTKKKQFSGEYAGLPNRIHIFLCSLVVNTLVVFWDRQICEMPFHISISSQALNRYMCAIMSEMSAGPLSLSLVLSTRSQFLCFYQLFVLFSNMRTLFVIRSSYYFYDFLRQVRYMSFFWLTNG